jgi:1-acyl-sn-glycerol-3-phosphate acyltransferase
VTRNWLRRLWYDINYLATMAAYVSGWSFRFQGGHHVPRSGPVLLLGNHQSFLDPVAIGLAASNRRVWFLARKTLFANPIFGAYLRSVSVVGVDQEGIAKEGLQVVLELLGQGDPVLMFPEGERSETGKMLPLKPGITLLLKKSEAPVVPVGIAGAFEAYPRSALLPRLSPFFLPATNAGVAVSIGPVIDRRRYEGKSREEVLDVLHQEIAVQFRRAEQLRRKATR